MADMSLIMEAIARRAQGGPLSGGTSMPAIDQVTAPTDSLPTGGPNTPEMPPAPLPSNAEPARMSANAGAGGPANQAVKTATKATSPAFDDETRMMAKNLAKRLLEMM